jgi:hypothetical protein
LGKKKNSYIVSLKKALKWLQYISVKSSAELARRIIEGSKITVKISAHFLLNLCFTVEKIGPKFGELL